MNAVNAPGLFLEKLENIILLDPHGLLLWSSEGDFPLSLVQFTSPLRSAIQSVDGRDELPTDWVAGQILSIAPDSGIRLDDYGPDSLRLGQFIALYGLFGCFSGNKQLVLKHSSKEEGVLDLYLLVQFDFTWAGIQTRIVET